jgi:regulatory protein
VVAREPQNSEAAYQAAVKRLARQPQPRAALEQRLLRLGYAQAAVTAALDRAQSKGYLDDRAYAEAVVRRRARGRGHALIAQELRAKGISSADITEALGSIDPESEMARAISLAQETLRRKGVTDPGRVRETVGPVLSRRGFAAGLISQVCRKLSAEWRADGWFDTSSEPD